MRIRNFIMSKKYKWLIKPIFFLFDPETIHDVMTLALKFIGGNFLTRKLFYACWGYSNRTLEQNILGIKFKNPVGLSAGFDKNAEMIGATYALGFGFTEVGSITGEKCEGNPKPRLWRLKKSKSLLVYYGLKNDGAEKISKRLRGRKFSLPVGISIAKTNCQATANDENAIADYFKAYTTFNNLPAGEAGIGNYFTINISCPNAFGGQPFTNAEKLERLLEKIFAIPKIKPVFLKLSPDLSREEIDEILEVCKKFPVDGYVCSNLTKNRNNQKILDRNLPETGGMSGKILDDLSDQLIRYVYKKTASKAVIIGVGGIASAEDAYRKIQAGASLLELITGMIYEGPQLISDINLGLTKLLQKDGYKNISEAVGKENP